jgi:hypothetical protein
MYYVERGILRILGHPAVSSVLASLPVGLKPIYFLHAQDSDQYTFAGSAVLSLDSLCPPFDSSPNSHIFRSRCGIEFHAGITLMSVQYLHLSSLRVLA